MHPSATGPAATPQPRPSPAPAGSKANGQKLLSISLRFYPVFLQPSVRVSTPTQYTCTSFSGVPEGSELYSLNSAEFGGKHHFDFPPLLLDVLGTSYQDHTTDAFHAVPERPNYQLWKESSRQPPCGRKIIHQQ